MSVASRPHRRLTIRAPADLPTVEAGDEGAPTSPGATDPAHPAEVAAPPARPQGRRLVLTASTGAHPASEPPVGAAPEGAGTQAPARAQPPARAGTEPPSGRPRRRLSLTMPTGLIPEDTPTATEARRSGKVDTPCYLRREIAERLEEEFWRRQAAGEACSRSEIIQAALDIALKDPQRLTAAISRLADGR